MLPESWLLYNLNELQDTPTAIVTPWHPTMLSNPASRPQRISAHHIASIKTNSNEMKSSQHTASYRSSATPCVIDSQTTQPDSPQAPDAVVLLDNPATR
jgi:hypothetical protein